jgi:hypothetical protein
MIEIICVYEFIGMIGDMARRRGRDPFSFGLLFVLCWIFGESFGAVLGYALQDPKASGKPNDVFVYGLALAGAALGVVAAFVVAKLSPPLDGIWRKLPAVRRSRRLGALVGGAAGGALGAFAAWCGMTNVEFTEGNWSVVVILILMPATLGTLLGLLSGLQTKQRSAPSSIAHDRPLNRWGDHMSPSHR